MMHTHAERRAHSFERSWEHGGRIVIDCKECGFKHLYPFPSPEEVETFYNSRYYEEVKPFDYDSVTPEKVDKTLRALKNNKKYRKIFRKLTELRLILKEEFPELPEKGHMIDIGCGNQLLAKFFQLHGWSGHAVELSDQACRYLQKFGVDVHQVSADEADLLPVTDLSFVNVQFVMEHMRDPSRFLSAACRSMHPGGLIRILVPNDFSAGQMAYRDYYQESCHWVFYPDHINYFSFDSLSALLSRHGFREVYRTATFPLEFLLLGGINYYGNKEFQQQVGPFVRNFEQAFIQTSREGELDRLYEKLAEIGMGRAIEMYAVKL